MFASSVKVSFVVLFPSSSSSSSWNLLFSSSSYEVFFFASCVYCSSCIVVFHERFNFFHVFCVKDLKILLL